MTALMHLLHYGLLAAGLGTVAVLAWTARRGRRDAPDDRHGERIRRLRDAVGDGATRDEHPGGAGPPSAG